MMPQFLQKRPFSVTIVLWGVFLLGTWNAGKAIAIIYQLPLFTKWPTTPSPTFRLVAALFWMALFWTLTALLWRKRPLTRQAPTRHTIPLAILLYAIYQTTITLLFATSQTTRQSWSLYAVLYTLFALYTCWALKETAVPNPKQTPRD